MKLLYIIQCTNLGGMEQTSSKQAALMKSSFGVEYRMISPRSAGKGSFLFRAVDPDMEFFEYKGKFNARGHRAFAARVYDLAKDVDMVYVTGTCVSSLRAARATGKPVILAHHFHHGEHWRSHSKWWLFYNLLCRALRGIIYISPFTRDEGLSIAPWLSDRALVARQSIIAHPTTNVERQRRRKLSRERLGIPQDAWVIGNAGWLIARKRFDVFLDVAALVKKSIPKALFIICGDGEEAEALKKRARDLGIGDNVEFRGWVSDLADHYQAWNVLLFNSDHDAVGRTALEAVGHGLNVVASVEHGGLAEFFSQGDRGYFFGEHDIEGMAAAIVRLHDDPDYAMRQADQAMDHLQRTYNDEAAVAPIKQILFG